jgi:hypothetical protein
MNPTAPVDRGDDPAGNMEPSVPPIKMTRITLIAFRVFLAAAFAVPAQAADSGATPKDQTAMPQPVERASVDDCAIFVEVGKSAMNWGAKPPGYAFEPEWDRDGGGTYLEECPWKELGVAEPLTKAQQPDASFFITRPRYSGAGATVDLEFSISGRIVDGKKTPPFIQSENCTLEKKDDRWHVVECRLKSIT